jgi:RNA recognition motif-containing protein
MKRMEVLKLQPNPRIKVGNLEYPAHPYTIRVSFLSPDTEDMDLVDIFRPKCGAIVHAKIMRDKHHGSHEKGKSKGWGLVQFEEPDSVEKALELSDVIGIHGKSVKIERSHLPAVSLVPPGMHRINPKGQGKSTKQNQRRRQEHQHKDASDGKMEHGKEAPTVESAAKKSNEGVSSTLMFRPRGVVKKSKGAAPKPKAKIAFSTAANNDDK